MHERKKTFSSVLYDNPVKFTADGGFYSNRLQRPQGFGVYLTRSMTRSLGAELTGSSLIMMISSPGSSFPSDGPPANTKLPFELRLHTILQLCFSVSCEFT